jgi:hypothetical protein
MAQLLTCPRGHHWDLTEDRSAVLRLTHGLCPQCGEPPVADSPIDWDRDGLFVVFGVALIITLFVLVAGPLMMRPRPETPGLICCGLVTSFAVGCAVTERACRYLRRQRLGTAAAALGFTFLPTVSRGRAVAVPLPPFLLRPRLLVGRRNCLVGCYQGSQVLVLDGVFRTRAGMLKPHTVVFFPEPIRGLSDFELQPDLDRSKLRHGNLKDLFDPEPLNPFLDEPFGRHYRLTAGRAGDVRPWLSPPLRAFLERQPGWVLGAWQGRFYLYRPHHLCRADDYTTLLAVAWRLRDMLRQTNPSS